MSLKNYVKVNLNFQFFPDRTKNMSEDKRLPKQYMNDIKLNG